MAQLMIVPQSQGMTIKSTAATEWRQLNMAFDVGRLAHNATPSRRRSEILFRDVPGFGRLVLQRRSGFNGKRFWTLDVRYSGSEAFERVELPAPSSPIRSAAEAQRAADAWLAQAIAEAADRST